MKYPTLDEFLIGNKDATTCRNAYVSEPGFETLYVRLTKRVFDECIWRTIDLASAATTHTGKGTFKALVKRLYLAYPDYAIYVESVMTERFANGLLRMGFRQLNSYFDDITPNFFMLPCSIQGIDIVRNMC